MCTLQQAICSSMRVSVRARVAGVRLEKGVHLSHCASAGVLAAPKNLDWTAPYDCVYAASLLRVIDPVRE